ncbi:MAG: fimbria/pilus periplasmic chaperone [Labilibaculum sp.]|nr:fimbria/pilus periplasmic chaperone [Labilibaculum sp.]
MIMILSLSSFYSYAGIVINGTRIIYSADAREVSIKLTNKGDRPVLIQSWIDNGDSEANPSEISVPFILTPPINRVNGGEGQVLRLSYTGSELPNMVESVFWLNVLEIPVKSKDKLIGNHLQMAFRTRIKLFFRPLFLEGEANDSARELIFNSTSHGVNVTNPTPYYISISKINVTVKGVRYSVKGEMISPLSSDEFSFPNVGRIPVGSTIMFNSINDYGAIVINESVVLN